MSKVKEKVAVTELKRWIFTTEGIADRLPGGELRGPKGAQPTQGEASDNNQW
jgi:hypothetical protein